MLAVVVGLLQHAEFRHHTHTYPAVAPPQQIFGGEAAAAALMHEPEVLSCPPAVWRRDLCNIGGLQRGGAVQQYKDHAAPSFLQCSLLLQQAFQLTAAQLYEHHPPHDLPGAVRTGAAADSKHQGVPASAVLVCYHRHRWTFSASRGRQPARVGGMGGRHPASCLLAVPLAQHARGRRPWLAASLPPKLRAAAEAAL